MRAGSGDGARATGRQMVVRATDDVYPHNFPSTGLDEEQG